MQNITSIIQKHKTKTKTHKNYQMRTIYAKWNVDWIWFICISQLIVNWVICIYVGSHFWNFYILISLLFLSFFTWYSGKERNLNILELLCASCYRWFHESCIGFQMGKLIPFATNYMFFCKNCSPTGLESFRKCQASKDRNHFIFCRRTTNDK